MVCWFSVGGSQPGPERSSTTVIIQYIFSNFQKCPFSANTVEGPVGNQCIGSISTVYTMLLLLPYRSKEGKLAVVRQCQGSLESVFSQCIISMSEIFK